MKKKKILVVDDEAGFTRLLKLTLERTGRLIVQGVNDPLRAIETAREFKPDLILLDVIMPGVDGGDLAAKFKGDPLLSHIPIVFLTAILGAKQDLGGQMEKTIGGYPFLSKPFSLDDLLRWLSDDDDDGLSNVPKGSPVKPSSPPSASQWPSE